MPTGSISCITGDARPAASKKKSRYLKITRHPVNRRIPASKYIFFNMRIFLFSHSPFPGREFAA